MIEIYNYKTNMAAELFFLAGRTLPFNSGWWISDACRNVFAFFVIPTVAQAALNHGWFRSVLGIRFSASAIKLVRLLRVDGDWFLLLYTIYTAVRSAEMRFWSAEKSAGIKFGSAVFSRHRGISQVRGASPRELVCKNRSAVRGN